MAYYNTSDVKHAYRRLHHGTWWYTRTSSRMVSLLNDIQLDDTLHYVRDKVK